MKFPEEINPQRGFRVRFVNELNAMEYLDYFKIINTVKRKFILLV